MEEGGPRCLAAGLVFADGVEDEVGFLFNYEIHDQWLFFGWCVVVVVEDERRKMGEEGGLVLVLVWDKHLKLLLRGMWIRFLLHSINMLYSATLVGNLVM